VVVAQDGSRGGLQDCNFGWIHEVKTSAKCDKKQDLDENMGVRVWFLGDRRISM
jgi:hypothetical protein